MIRREIYEAVGLYDNRLRQLPDFDMWIRVVKVSDIFVSPSVMVRFRILPGENTSSDTPTNHIRTLNEHFFIGLGFFDNVSADLLRQGFGDCLSRPSLPLASTLDIEAALLFFRPVVSLERVYKFIGLLKLRDLLGNERSRTWLAAHYDFDDRTLQRLAVEVDTLHKEVPQPPQPSRRPETSHGCPRKSWHGSLGRGCSHGHAISGAGRPDPSLDGTGKITRTPRSKQWPPVGPGPTPPWAAVPPPARLTFYEL